MRPGTLLPIGACEALWALAAILDLSTPTILRSRLRGVTHRRMSQDCEFDANCGVIACLCAKAERAIGNNDVRPPHV